MGAAAEATGGRPLTDEQLDEMIVQASVEGSIHADDVVNVIAEVRRLRVYVRAAELRTQSERYGQLQRLHAADPAAAEAIADAYMGVLLPHLFMSAVAPDEQPGQPDEGGAGDGR